MAGRKVLLVEGTDDEHVVKGLCGQHGLPHLDEIKPLGSVEKLVEHFPVRLKESGLARLGVVVDADTDVGARWRSLRDRLLRAGYPDVPQVPDPTGTIILPPADVLAALPRVGVWIMPDNRTSGILEDFLRFLVPQGSPLFEHVDSSLSTIPEGERRFGPLAEPKARIHTWLAWQKEPGKPLGQAITARFLDPTVPQADAFVSWLVRLFFR